MGKVKDKKLFIGEWQILVTSCPVSLIISVVFILIMVKYSRDVSTKEEVAAFVLFCLMPLALIIMIVQILLQNFRIATLTEQGIFFHKLFTSCKFLKWENILTVETCSLYTAIQGGSRVFTKWIALHAKNDAADIENYKQGAKDKKRNKFPQTEFLIRYTKKNAEVLLTYLKLYRVDIWRDITQSERFEKDYTL